MSVIRGPMNNTWGILNYKSLTILTKLCLFQVEHLLMAHDWIADEKKFFGQPHTAYDFEANNPQEANRRLQKLQETKEKLSKSVNMRAMNMLGKAEEQVGLVLI